MTTAAAPAPRSILDGLASGVLPPTLTYDDRAWSWVPQCEPPADGKLTIRQRRYRGRRHVEIDSYLVQEQEPEIGIPGRSFLVAKQSGENAPVYQTIIGPLQWCDCVAGRVNHTSCRHRDAIAAMILEGIL